MPSSLDSNTDGNDSYVSDDAALMQAIARRESEALRLLYQRHAPLILALCMRITQSRSDAEDVVLDVFLEIWQRSDRYDPMRASPLTYLTMVARSRALDSRRGRAGVRAGARSTSDIAETATPAHAAADATPDGPLGELLAGEARASVRSALSGLATEERELIEFCYFDGMTHVQIAERTHQPLGTIKTRIRRGLSRLRGRLRCVWDERPRPGDDSSSKTSSENQAEIERESPSALITEIPQSAPGPEGV